MTADKNLFDGLLKVSTPDDAARVVREFGEAISVDRCFLYLRDPKRRSGIVAACWLKDRGALDLPPHDYLPFDPEPEFLHTSDPMFVAALSGHPWTYVDDVRSAGDLVNAEFEAEFNHRALIHINLHADGDLVGILQPAMNVVARSWALHDRNVAEAARSVLGPLIGRAMASGPWAHAPVRQWGDEPLETVCLK